VPCPSWRGACPEKRGSNIKGKREESEIKGRASSCRWGGGDRTGEPVEPDMESKVEGVSHRTYFGLTSSGTRRTSYTGRQRIRSSEGGEGKSLSYPSVDRSTFSGTCPLSGREKDYPEKKRKVHISHSLEEKKSPDSYGEKEKGAGCTLWREGG